VLKLQAAQFSFNVYGWQEFNSSDPVAMRNVTTTLANDIDTYYEQSLFALFVIGLVIWGFCVFVLYLLAFQSPGCSNLRFQICLCGTDEEKKEQKSKEKNRTSSDVVLEGQNIN